MPYKNISKLNKKQKILLCGILLLLVFILVLYSSIPFYKLSAAGSISKLRQAVIGNDAKTAASLIKSSDKKLKIDKNSIQCFIDYLNTDPTGLKNLIDTLHDQEQSLDSSNKPKCWDFYMVLKKSDKGFLGLPTYYFEMKPCYVDLSTNYPINELYIDDKYIFTPMDKGDEICGPFVQGLHTVKAVCESFLGKSESTRCTDFITTYSAEGTPNNFACQIPIDHAYCADIYYNYDDAEVYVNGKDTGKTVSDIYMFGPLEYDTPVKVYAEKNFPWGTFRSTETTLNRLPPEMDYASGYGSDYIDMSISPVSDEISGEIQSAVAQYNKSIITPALKSRSTEFSPISFSNGNSMDTLRSSLQKEYKDMSAKGISFTGSYLSSKIDRISDEIDYDSQKKVYLIFLTSTDYYTQDYGTEDSPVKTRKNGVENSYKIEYDVKNKRWTASIIIDSGGGK